MSLAGAKSPKGWIRPISPSDFQPVPGEDTAGSSKSFSIRCGPGMYVKLYAKMDMFRLRDVKDDLINLEVLCNLPFLGLYNSLLIQRVPCQRVHSQKKIKELISQRFFLQVSKICYLYKHSSNELIILANVQGIQNVSGTVVSTLDILSHFIILIYEIGNISF